MFTLGLVIGCSETCMVALARRSTQDDPRKMSAIYSSSHRYIGKLNAFLIYPYVTTVAPPPTPFFLPRRVLAQDTPHSQYTPLYDAHTRKSSALNTYTHNSAAPPTIAKLTIHRLFFGCVRCVLSCPSLQVHQYTPNPLPNPIGVCVPVYKLKLKQCIRQGAATAFPPCTCP